MEMEILNHLMISCTYIFVAALQCHWDSNASSDQDYRSSRNIAISLFKRYRNVIDRGSGDNLKVCHLSQLLDEIDPKLTDRFMVFSSSHTSI